MNIRLSKLGKVVVHNEETAHKDIAIDPKLMQNHQLLQQMVIKRLSIIEPAIESLEEDEAELVKRSLTNEEIEQSRLLIADLHEERKKLHEILQKIEGISVAEMKTIPVALNRITDVSRELKGYLIEDQIERALQRLGDLLKEESSFFNEYVVLSAQYNRAVRQHRTGIMPYLAFNETMNKIILALTGIIDLLEAKDIKSNE